MRSKSVGHNKSLLTIEEEKQEQDVTVVESRASRSLNESNLIREGQPGDLGGQDPSSTTSINASLPAKRSPLEVGQRSQLIREEGKVSEASKKGLLSIIEEIKAQGPIKGDDPLVNKLSSWESRDELKKQLIEELKPVLSVSSKLKLHLAIKQMLENICILLVWFSCIYK